MLMDIVTSDAFGGRGSQGPQIIMTDDSTSERNALKRMFPGIIALLCLFHVLQAMWRYIWDSKHKADSSDKLEIYILFRDVCYEQNEDDFKEKYESMLAFPKVKANSGLVKHFKDLYERAPEWALAYRVDLLTRGNNTNNYSEATVRLMKDLVFQRLKAYSEVQMFDFFTTRLEAFFERRLANVLNGRQENYWKSKHFIHPSKLAPLRCEKSPQEGFYLVKNVERKTEYVVDMKHEVCSCHVGRNGAPCKHQMAVVQSFNIMSTQLLPIDLESKLALHKIMTTVSAPPEWYAPLKGGPYVPNNAGTVAADISLDNQDTTLDGAGASEELDFAAGSTTESGTIFDQAKLSAALEKWEDINTYMINSLKSRPDVFVDAVDKFSVKFQRAKDSSENQLLSAFHTFNRQAAGHRSVVRKYIYSNSSSIQKRKQPSLGGRKCTHQGRPPKSAYTTEHGYPKSKAKKTAGNIAPTKRSAIPHSLALKVSEQSQPKKPRLKL
ncbi:uncharacterized protein LOC117651038 [Thrips palmi]|uniref:Uncharacterized protein LOC117651038 n=1 Tax=Thrips palmi TaxID=161013 RepID=A0A6P8ZYW0_THRPL|nr:uncharacterized protein LOC117651038 [Thrips palmi]